MSDIPKLCLLASIPLLMPFVQVRPVAVTPIKVQPTVQIKPPSSPQTRAVTGGGRTHLASPVVGANTAAKSQLPSVPQTHKHTVKTVVVASAISEAKEMSGECLCEKALAYYNSGDYSKAAFYYSKASIKMAEEWGPNNSDVADAIYGEGLSYYQMGNYRIANQLYARSLQTYKKLPNINKSDIACVYWAMGNSAAASESWKQSITAFTDAVTYYRQVKPSKDFASCLRDFADCYQRQGATEKAEQLIAQARHIERSAS